MKHLYKILEEHAVILCLLCLVASNFLTGPWLKTVYLLAAFLGGTIIRQWRENRLNGERETK